MQYTIDGAAKTPAYIQLYEQLRRDIVAGVYALGTKLPSKRLFSAELGISVVTVEHALSILADEGYIGTRERSGYFVIYRADDGFVTPAPVRAKRRRVPHTEGREDAMPFSVLARTMRRVIAEYGEEILERSPTSGCAQLRRAISDYLLRSRGMTVAPEQVVVGSGAEHLYGLVVQMLGVARPYATEDPCYEKIRAVYRSGGATVEGLPLDEEGIAPEALAASRAGVLHVTPYHSFPSGVTATASRRRAYLDFIAARDGVLIEDDFDSEFTVSAKMEDTLFSQDKGDRVIYMNSFTKTVAASLRVAYMVLPPSLLPLFLSRVGFYSCTVPTFEQYVLADLLDSGDFERHINRRRREMRRRQGK